MQFLLLLLLAAAALDFTLGIALSHYAPNTGETLDAAFSNGLATNIKCRFKRAVEEVVRRRLNSVSVHTYVFTAESGVLGFSWETLARNLKPHFEGQINTFAVFGVFFPAGESTFFYVHG